MPNEITVTSSTDSEAAVREAAAYGGNVVTSPEPEARDAEPSEAPEAEPDAESEPAEDEESTEEEPEEEEESKAKPEQKGLARGEKKLLRRVNRLTGRVYSLQEENDLMRERLSRYEQGKPAEAKPAAAADGRPVPEQFKTTEEYLEAVTDWKIDQREKAQAKAAQDEFLKEIFADYNRQIETARDEHEDFDEVVNQAAKVPVIAVNALYEMDNGAEVAYFLGQHPDVRAKLNEWNEPGTKGGWRRIVAEVHKISEQLNGNNGSSPSRQASPKPPRPQPPPPIRPVSSGSSTRSTARPDEMSYRDYKQWHNTTFGNVR